MRILTIRGKNLASLANGFEVQLEQGVLQSAGLFAITGPTGSGKSTLLDALCLALYDKMPRLPDGHSVFIGHKDEDESIRVKSNDVSSILRRGTASAYAEVDFLGKNKQSYRARWEISRARGKVDGKLQPQIISLQNLDTLEKIGEGKRDTLQKIETCIGLNFDQFRRSVLLAQGDFAAFLKAKKDDRSNLLEKITGTDIYSELSIAAFERAKNEKQRLDNISEKLADKTPLTQEERHALEEEKQRISNELAVLQKEIRLKQEALKWFATQKTLKQDEIKTQQELQLAQSNWDLSQSDRDQLRQIELVQPLRPLLQQSIDLSKEITEAEESIQTNQGLLNTADKNLQQLIALSKVAELNHLEAIKQHKTAQPLLQQARQLDTQIESSANAVNELENNRQRQNEQWKNAELQLKTLQQQNTEKEVAKQQRLIWQEQHAAVEEIAQQWERWENEIKAYIVNEQSIEQLIHEKSDLQKRLVVHQKSLTAAQEKEAQSLIKKNNLNETINELKIQVDQYSLAKIHQQKDLLEQKTAEIKRACEIADKGIEHQSSVDNDKQALVDVEQNIQQINDQNPELLVQLQQKQIQLVEAQNAFNLIQAASQKTAEDLRGLLQENEACPVCGSEEHPWGNSELASTIKQPVEKQQKRLAVLNAEKDQLITEQSKNNSEVNRLDKDKQTLLERIKNTEDTLNQLANQWMIMVFDDKPEWISIHKNDVEKLKQLNVVLKADYAKVKLQEQQALDCQKKLDLLRTQFDKVTDNYAKQHEETATFDKQLAKQSTALVSLEKDLARVEQVKTESIQLLSTPFKRINDWQARLNQEAAAFVQTVSKDVLKWQETTEDLKNIEDQLAGIKTKLAVATSEEDQQQGLLKKHTKDLENARQNKQNLVDERHAFFHGQPANQFSEQLEKQVEQTEAEKKNTETNLAAIKIEITSCNAAVEHWLKEQQRRTRNKIDAEQKLDQAIQQIKLDKQTLQALLKKDSQWIEAQQNKFKALTVKLQEATATLKVKTQNLIDHAENTPDIEESDLLVKMEALSQTQDKMGQEKENNSFILRSDDEKINLGKTLYEELKIQTKHWEKWESLNELIGSSNGQKFRIFAQSLTLETLLSYTNSHLQEFAKRYHLQRVPGSDLELQVVDRDMADEVRSVHSLSGGESFLVSLALALGLASLSSNKIQVESLFIDEGFGSLDQETLDIAISSLDTLQSLGRKVGVISHVPVLVERIGAKVVVEKIGGGQSSVSIRAY